MPRPRKIIRTVEKSISIPEDLCARIDVLLVSSTEKKLPFAAYQEFFVGLANEYFARGSPPLKEARPSVWMKVYRGLEHIEAVASSPDIVPQEALSRISRWAREYKDLLSSKEAEMSKH